MVHIQQKLSNCHEPHPQFDAFSQNHNLMGIFSAGAALWDCGFQPDHRIDYRRANMQFFRKINGNETTFALSVLSIQGECDKNTDVVFETYLEMSIENIKAPGKSRGARTPTE